MNDITPDMWLLFVGAALIVGYALGRATAGATGVSGGDRRMQEQMEAEMLFLSMSPTAQAEADRLIDERQYIMAIKNVRDATGAGLKEAKMAVDYRRRAKGQR